MKFWNLSKVSWLKVIINTVLICIRALFQFQFVRTLPAIK